MGVVGPVAARWRVPALVCRGYASLTALEETADRITDGRSPRAATIVYVGDHDPSGLYMDRDLQDRLDRLGAYADIERVALTADQIDEHQLPPQPTKTGDSRARCWTHDGSWELDALPAAALDQIISDAIEGRTPADWATGSPPMTLCEPRSVRTRLGCDPPERHETPLRGSVCDDPAMTGPRGNRALGA